MIFHFQFIFSLFKLIHAEEGPEFTHFKAVQRAHSRHAHTQILSPQTLCGT